MTKKTLPLLYKKAAILAHAVGVSVFLLAAPASAQKVEQTRPGGNVTSSVVSIPANFSANSANITFVTSSQTVTYVIISTISDFDSMTANRSTMGVVGISSLTVTTATIYDLTAPLIAGSSAVIADVSVSTLVVGEDIILPGVGSVVNALGSLSGMAIIRADGSPCPLGWSEMTAAGGRYLVGLSFGGTGNGTKGTGMGDLAANPGHRHDVTVTSAIRQGGGAAPTGVAGTYTSTLEAVVPPAGQVIAPYIQVRLCIIP
jgi:hypothetical protein